MRSKRDARAGAIHSTGQARGGSATVAARVSVDPRLDPTPMNKGKVARGRSNVAEENAADIPTDHVAARCWCDRKVVWIARTDIGVRTESCGGPDCRDPRGE